MKTKVSPLSKALLCLLLLTDLGFILLYLVVWYTQFSTDTGFILDVDRSHSEIFQYIKEYWMALALGYMAIRSRSWLWGVWSVFFFYLLADDSIEIHERLGLLVGRGLGFSQYFNIRARDFGELVVYGTVALLFLIAITIAYRVSSKSDQQATRKLIQLLGVFACFLVLADLLHSAVKIPALEPFLIALEDGGELIAMSLIAVFVFSKFEKFLSIDQSAEVSSKSLV